MDNTTIGITGVDGFIGSNLTKYLNQLNIFFVPFKGNLLDESDVTSFYKSHSIETVIHLAGTFLLPFEKQLNVNVLVTQKLLDIGIQNGLKKIIFTSTGAVYGEPINDVSYETDALRPNTLYGLTKRFAEECIQFYAHENPLQYVILRFPNVYGKDNNKGVIYEMLRSIQTKGKITINGNGEQSRNFLHVADAVKAIITCLDYPDSEVFNISNPIDVSINDLVEKLKKNHDFSIEYQPVDNNLKKLSLNIDKARKLLHFEPRVTEVQI